MNSLPDRAMQQYSLTAAGRRQIIEALHHARRLARLEQRGSGRSLIAGGGIEGIRPLRDRLDADKILLRHAVHDEKRHDRQGADTESAAVGPFNMHVAAEAVETV